MFGLIQAVAALSWAAPLPAPPPCEPEVNRPVLVARGRDYVIQAVLRSGEIVPAIEGRPATTSSALALLHNSITTGKSTCLAAGARLAFLDPILDMPVRPFSTTYYLARVAGVTTDGDRLYVLYWLSVPVVVSFEDELKNRKSHPGPKFDKGSYRLLVFHAADGFKTQDLLFTEGDFPEGPPKETCGKGPLQLRADGMACFGVTFRFKGTELIRQKYEGKKP